MSRTSWDHAADPLAALARFARRLPGNRRRHHSGTQRWLAPVCWMIGHDEGTNGRVCWCRRCGVILWKDTGD